MQRIGTLVIVLSVLFAVAGCGVARRATRSPETDALLRAARAGNADTVRHYWLHRTWMLMALMSTAIPR